MSEDYCGMWEALGLDLEAHDQLLSVIPPLYQDVYLNQENRPKGMEYFDFVVMEIHGLRIKELQEHKEKGGKVVGTFCLYAPEELITAGGALSIGLCTGAEVGIEAAEQYLPRNTCSLIKSFMGFKLAKICPYFESCDMVVGETTCDSKKKAYEILGDFANVHVLELPQMKREKDREFWRGELMEFRATMEELTGNAIDAEALRSSIKTANAKRRALQRLNELRKNDPVPISGKDCLLIEQIAFYDDPIRFTQMVEKLNEELEERVAAGAGVAPKGTTRLLVSGCPMAIPNWKLPQIIEDGKAVIVGEESCIGQRYFRDLVDESGETVEEMVAAIADKTMKIDCACFTPNTERTDSVKSLSKELKADGVVHYSLQFCNPYLVEFDRIKRALDEENIPVLRIDTDYSQEDAGQLKTRVDAFVEMVSG